VPLGGIGHSAAPLEVLKPSVLCAVLERVEAACQMQEFAGGREPAGESGEVPVDVEDEIERSRRRRLSIAPLDGSDPVATTTDQPSDLATLPFIAVPA
jgi:hypothetical protein